MLAFIAERLLALGDAPPHGALRTAWNGGEMLYAEQSAVFEKAFGVPLRNVYGGRELSAMACQTVPGGPLRVFRPWVFVEIVDEHGKPVSPGESGRLIWTSTVCRGTPFLRFDVGDLGAASASHITEAGITALDELHGRTAGLLKLPNGRTINNIFWNHLFKEYPEVAQFQVLLRSNGGIRILLRGRGLTPEREARLRSVIDSVIDHLPLELQWVESIPLTSQGKRIQVLRETA
jgi:phenylacetate-CoA ligase